MTKPAAPKIPEPPAATTLLQDALTPPGDFIGKQDLTIDDIVDLHAYLMAKGQNTLVRLGLEPTPEVCNSVAATVMIDIQRRGISIPAKVREQ